jgi:fatty acid desaturase
MRKQDTSSSPTDLRGRRRREQRRLFWIVATFLVVAGGIAIALVYGLPSAMLGLVCLLTGAGILGLLWLILLLIERLAQ